MSNYIIAFDIGGTRIKYGVVSLDGTLEKTAMIPSNNNDGPEELFSTIDQCVSVIRSTQKGALAGIALGLSGGVDPDFGVVLLPGKFKSLEGYPIVPLLKERYQVPVFADNDGRLAAYAEKYFGKVNNRDWAVVLTIGTGIGSGVILNGQILSDPHLLFGTQIGHLVLNTSDDRTCLTGNKGTGEILCSSTALALQVRSAIQRGIPSELTDLYYQDPFRIDFHQVIQACRNGDDLCLQELQVWIHNLSMVLINAVHCYAPKVIILSGGATHAADLFLNQLRERVNRQVFRCPKDRQIEIVISEMQEYAGVMGAAAMMMEKINFIKDARVDKINLK